MLLLKKLLSLICCLLVVSPGVSAASDCHCASCEHSLCCEPSSVSCCDEAHHSQADGDSCRHTNCRSEMACHFRSSSKGKASVVVLHHRDFEHSNEYRVANVQGPLLVSGCSHSNCGHSNCGHAKSPTAVPCSQEASVDPPCECVLCGIQSQLAVVASSPVPDKIALPCSWHGLNGSENLGQRSSFPLHVLAVAASQYCVLLCRWQN